MATSSQAHLALSAVKTGSFTPVPVWELFVGAPHILGSAKPSAPNRAARKSPIPPASGMPSENQVALSTSMTVTLLSRKPYSKGAVLPFAVL